MSIIISMLYLLLWWIMFSSKSRFRTVLKTNFAPKSLFGLSSGSGTSDMYKNWHSEATLSWKPARNGVFSIFADLTSHGEVKCQNFAPKSRYNLSFGSCKSNLDKNWHSDEIWLWEQASDDVFAKFAKLTLYREVKAQNLT